MSIGFKEWSQSFHFQVIRRPNNHDLMTRHRDLTHLERLLRNSTNKRAIVITETLFSMDGDFADLQVLSQTLRCVKVDFQRPWRDSKTLSAFFGSSMKHIPCWSMEGTEVEPAKDSVSKTKSKSTLFQNPTLLGRHRCRYAQQSFRLYGWFRRWSRRFAQSSRISRPRPYLFNVPTHANRCYRHSSHRYRSKRKLEKASSVPIDATHLT